MATFQTFTFAPTGGTTKGIAIHFADGRVVHYKHTDITKIVADGTWTGDSTSPTDDPVVTSDMKDGSEQ